MTSIKTNIIHIGLLAAMKEELGAILENLVNTKIKKYGDLEIYSGEWNKQSNQKLIISIAWSGWGKISASRAATRLISTTYQKRKVDLIIFSGVAGAVESSLNQWDIVLSEAIIQHDMDARPLYEKFVIPSLNQKKIKPNSETLEKFYKIISNGIKTKKLSSFGSIYKGLIATGDMFISDNEKIKDLSQEIPSLLAVEMEGAALAQVAYQEKIDWIIIRVISDSANEKAEDDFSAFITKYQYRSLDLLEYILSKF
ncbi:5'-methylthioadenosine/adenosylhomocysteine nucleosidase [Prochlorococcus sp. AH-716-M09]|nr:5'-methylthioadenosine/adenosylhomocysteine nucleosidase [Prochlorococcus sp. AH-716-M09]